MIKGNNRRMFRKPGLARQAIGILASSKELMNEVQPVRMVGGGDAALEQARQQVLASGISPTNPLFDQLVGRIYSNTSQSPLAIRGGASSLSQYLSSPTLGDFLPTRRQPPPQDFRQTGEYLPDLGDPVEMIGGGISRLVQGGGARDESGTGEPRPQRIKPQGTPGGTLGGIETILATEGDRISRALGNPVLDKTDEERYGSDAIDLLKMPPRGVEGARGTAEFQEKMSPSDLALDTRRLNTDRATLNRAQRRLNTAQRAYDKTVANGSEEQQAESLAKLTQARNEVKRLAPIVADLEETVSTGKRKQTLDKFSGQLDNINRQLADENISDKARQKLLTKRNGLLSRMEEEGFGSRSRYEPPEGEKATPSDPAISFEEAEAREAAIEEQEKEDAPSPRTDAPSPAVVADEAAKNVEESTGSNLTNPGEKKGAVELYLETLQGKEKPERDPRDQKIIEEAMRGAEYDEDEIKKNIKDDAFWNAVMLTGLNMVVGSSEGGDRFSNMARSAIAGINTFNADVKEREKTAYKKFIDKQNRNLQKANLILSQEKTEADREFREFTKVMQLQAAEDLNFFKIDSARRDQQNLDLRRDNLKLQQLNKRSDFVSKTLGDRQATRSAEDLLRETPGYEKYATRKAKGGKNKTITPDIPRRVLQEFLEKQAVEAFPFSSFAPPASGSVIVLDE